ncbi:hypothetical protein [Bacillus tequilensis]|uniref:hypothetical protein n=1 Tax=Bacillus tequilensis TaxID=227866 RepID=UPI000466FC90|nr:hypothetical protein [Bacillus tequilensis]MDR4436327.1 hypothetical protein [Bacillus tequilensis]
MIHLKMLGLGLLTIFKFIGFSILMVLLLSLTAILLCGWIYGFMYGFNLIAWSILVIDLLIVSYFIGDYVLHVTIPAKEKAQADV